MSDRHAHLAALAVVVALGIRYFVAALEDIALAMTLLLWTVIPAGLLVWLAPRWRQRRDAVEVNRWAAVERDMVRTERLEDLGHTQGGLSAPDRAEAGQLSESTDGQLSEPDP